MKRIALLGSFMLLFWGMKGQDCGCDITLNNLKSSSLNLIWGNDLNYSPGDTICIPAGSYAGLRFYDLVGTENQPIVIKNCGGQVILNEPVYSAVSFQRSQYIHFTGTGDSNTPYGFYVGDTGGGAAGLYVENLSSDLEIDHIEVAYAGFAGIMAKTDPSCNRPETWRSSGFVLKNLNIHHNYIHHTAGEGIYLGFTGGYKIQSNRSCDGTPIFGHWLDNVDVHHNILEDIGWDGIQVNLGRENVNIHDNSIVRYGNADVYFQNFGMSIGAGVYNIFNNTLINENGGTGQGMQFISVDSGTKIYNNLLVNPDFHGFFLHQRHEFKNPEEGYYIANNTIITPENSGVFYNSVITITEDPSKQYQTQDLTPTYLVNNLIVDPGNDFASGNTWKKDPESYFDFNNRSTRDSLLPYIYNNHTSRELSGLGLIDPNSLNFRPGPHSIDLIDKGVDLTSWGIMDDLDKNKRPQGISFDIGAFEAPIDPLEDTTSDSLQGTANLLDQIILYPNPTPDGIFEVQVPTGFNRNSQMTILNFSGQVFFKSTLNKYQKNPVFLPAGFYFVELGSTNQKVVKKLVVSGY